MKISQYHRHLVARGYICKMKYSILSTSRQKFSINFQNQFISSKTGKGGNAGRQTVYVRNFKGKLDLKTCAGKGSRGAKNGIGGVGKSV